MLTHNVIYVNPMDKEFPAKRFGEKLQALRTKQGLTQKQLAGLLDVHVSYIGRMENNDKHPNVAMVLKLSLIFDVTTDVLIKDELELE